MIPPNGNWVHFTSAEEKLAYLKKWGLVSGSAKNAKMLIYDGIYHDGVVECKVQGRIDEKTVVVSIDDELHCILCDCLSDMQAGYSSILPPETYIVLDLETTGFSPANDGILEIAAVKYQYGQEIDRFLSFVNPQCAISLHAEKVNRITQDMIDDAPCFADILPDIEQFIETHHIVAHNATFDISFLKANFKRCGKEFLNPSIDTLKLARRAFPELKSHSLENLCSHLKINNEQSHRALFDVCATAEIYQMCSMKLIEEVRNSKAKKGEVSSEAIDF